MIDQDKLVICVGNTSRQTDLLTTKYAKKYLSVNRGLITHEQPNLSDRGFYHTSFGDIGNTTGFVKLLKNFDYIIVFNQPKESFNDEYEYENLFHGVKLANKRYKIPVEIIEVDAEKA